MLMTAVVDPTPKDLWPPTLELTGSQARHYFLSAPFLATALPMFAGLAYLASFVRRHSFSNQEHASMVWWLVNLFWFHTGCDILSGLFQIMPVTTQIYERMSPGHLNPKIFAEPRVHLDTGYVLELLVEVPLAAWVLWLFMRRDPARHVAEVFALAVQFAGTVCYYAPGLYKMEVACWLSWADRACGSVWIIYPIILLRGHLAAARKEIARGAKASNGSKKGR